ncbi:MAG: TIGR04348 family glycosyltransferase [Rhodopirellula sp.]|nr:TIGR04348 family glycosyltransferase [Rhodopirellula sp.]
MARILIVTPAPRGSRNGNRVTANRWARLLKACGHEVAIREEFTGQKCDALIAFHARKSSASIDRCNIESPATPIVLLLTGTDLYGDIHQIQSAATSLERANRLVLLQSHGIRELSPHLQSRVRVIVQSAEPPSRPPQPLKTVFEICVSGHLRPVKDPFRAAFAARQLPAESRIQITHLGTALTPAMERRAIAEMNRNHRYRWLGEVPNRKARQLLARSRLLVLSSKMEGGANVISEAIAASVPILASRISGSIGLLGDDYPGYFDVGSTKQLTSLMRRCEQDKNFYATLHAHVQKLAPLFTPQCEQNSLRQLISDALQE